MVVFFKYAIITTIILLPKIICIDYSNYDTTKMNKLLNSCVRAKFNSFECDAKKLVDNFKDQDFTFTTPSEIERYIMWLQLMSRMQEYDAQSSLLDSLDKFNRKIALVDRRISRKMKIVASNLFAMTSDLYIRNVNSANMRRTFVSFHELCSSFIMWNDRQFKTCLVAYASIRETFEKNVKITELIDRAAVQLSRIALEHPLMIIPKTQIKQDIYMCYVSKFKNLVVSGNRINYDDSKFDKNLYEKIEDVMYPFNTRFDMGPIRVFLHHNITRNDVLIKISLEMNTVYRDFKDFYRRLQLPYHHNLTDIDMYVHNDREQYVRLGPYWNYGVNNGGITQYVHDRRVIRAHVYFKDYEHDDLPNAYGHEFHHCLLFTLQARFMPKWYIEGAADRFGNRDCFWRDHEGLKAYRNTTIAEIIKADYKSNILYSMGSALVSFLYEVKPSILRSMIVKQNYSIDIDSVLENDFNVYKLNRIAKCEKIINSKDASDVDKNTVQEQYLRMIDNRTFAVCHNYIQIDFDDCAFILTPHRLIKQNKNKRPDNTIEKIVAQHEIKTNQEPVSQFDFEYLQKGLVKMAVRYLMPSGAVDHHNVLENFFNIDNDYWYNGMSSCRNDTQAIIKLARATSFWSRLMPFTSIRRPSPSADSQEAEMLKNLMNRVDACQVFIAPPSINSNVSLRSFANNVARLRNEKISPQNLLRPVDLRNNTLVHLAAIYNQPYFELLLRRSGGEVSFMSILNIDRNTPVDLYHYTKKYIERFNFNPNKYCFSFVVKKSSLVYKPIHVILNVTKKIIPPHSRFPSSTTTTTTIVPPHSITSIIPPTPTTISTKIDENDIFGNGNDDKGKKSGNEENNEENVSIILEYFIVFLGVLCIVLILVNIALTITLVKYISRNNKNNKSDKKMKNDKYFNKDKFYSNSSNECNVRLFN
uniref:Uncharacterized protein n=1 Tax=Chrysodeixis includens nucleopolyhedrovirus TaxID=1207438 RepID=A0A6B9CL18_9ABAC|nr:hypothetical protein [Chrysodeixis includens nucleopolyhedrovirus]QGW49968.1 hypothetical protein [Chrysodeixis includens nucleopolyhedrovirus]